MSLEGLPVNRSLKASFGEGSFETVALLPRPNHIVEATEGKICEAAFHKILSGHKASPGFICGQAAHFVPWFIQAANNGWKTEINYAVN
jgi:hypothetical protein